MYSFFLRFSSFPPGIFPKLYFCISFLFCLLLSEPQGCFLMLYFLNLLYLSLFSGLVLSKSFMASWIVAHQAPLSMGFPRQEYRSGFPFPLQWICLTQGLNLRLLQ